jgi:peptide/nickel transport system substrate-binding protein
MLRGSAAAAGVVTLGGLTACTPTTAGTTPGPATPGAAATPTRAAGAAPGAVTVGGKQIQYARFLSNPPDFAAQPKQGGTLLIATQYVPANFDPIAISSVTVGQWLGPVYNRLIRGKFGAEMNPYDPWKFEPQGELAESWTASPDGTEYTIKLRQGVKFHNVPPTNGREMTSDDVKWSFENNKTDIADTLKAAGAVFSTPDKYTVKIGLKGKVSWMIPLLADSRAYILPKEQADRPGGFKDNTPVGTGPFIMRSYEARVKGVYAKNPDYFERGKPYLDGLELQVVVDPAAQRVATKGGQVHAVQGDGLTPLEIEQFIRTSPDLTVFQRDSQSGAAIWHISMRMDQAPFNDVRVRRAISMGFNRKGIIDGIYAGAAKNLLPFPWTYAYDSEPTDLGPYYKYDPEGAKKLLTEAGVREGTTWEFLIGQYGPTVRDIAQLIQADFKKIGINLDIKSPDLTTFVSQYRPTGQKPTYPHLAYGIVFTNPVDPTLNLNSNLRSDAVINTDQMNDPKLDKMLSDLATEPDAQKQRPMLRQIWEYMSDQAYWPGIPEALSTTYFSKQLINYLPNYRNDALHWGMPQTKDMWLNK